jgi:chromate reductase, NAD(P)H dehydrogenase (quinone)
MFIRKKVIAISGSTRHHSTNHELIQAIRYLFKEELDIQLSNSIAELPHFNPDFDTDSSPQSVARFRQQLNEADGILICTPEYAMGVPGTLKNAIDWTVSSCEFSHKPTALITASSSGQKGHRSLMETLKVIEAAIPEDSQLVISYVKTKVKEAQIVDAATLDQVKQIIHSLIHVMDQQANRKQ